MQSNNKFINKLILSTVILKQLDTNEKPIANASGCIVLYGGKRWLISVSHAVRYDELWRIQIKSDPEIKKTILEHTGQMNYLKLLDIHKEKTTDIDFAYTVIRDSVRPFYQELTSDWKVSIEKPMRDCSIDFNLKPDKELKYGFFGLTDNKLTNGVLTSEPILDTSMTYLGSENEYYKFKLSKKWPTNKIFYGISGAPIMDELGNLISLFVAGPVDSEFIYGVDFEKFKTPFDVELKQI